MSFRFSTRVSSAVPAAEAPAPPTDPVRGPLSADELALMQRYWQAANYLTIGQIYLGANPLLREPLRGSTSSPACSATGAHLPASR